MAYVPPSRRSNFNAQSSVGARSGPPPAESSAGRSPPVQRGSGGSYGASSSFGGRGEIHPGKLFVGGLSWGTDDRLLAEVFGQHGDLQEARVVMERDDPSKSRGFAFVTYTDPAAAAAAVQLLDGSNVDGRGALRPVLPCAIVPVLC